MFFNKRGLNIIKGGRVVGDEIKIKTILFSDIVFIVANLVGLAVLVWLVWPIL